MTGEGFSLAAGFLVPIVAAGIFGGVVSGLLGVGGGIVIVPILYHVLDLVGVDESLKMQVAVATSLTTIVFTSLSSLRSHRKRNAIDVNLLKSWAVSIVIGVVIGSLLGGSVDGRWLSGVFGVVAAMVAVKMLFFTNGAAGSGGFRNDFVKWASGLVVGFISALMGIGGGTLSVPILTTAGYDIRIAVGTASAIGFFIAIPGTVGYVLTGWGMADLPPYSLGYVNWAAALLLIPLTTAMAPVGAWLAHAIPRRALQVCFSLFLLATSAKMLHDLYQALWQ